MSDKIIVDFQKEATVFYNVEGELVERLSMLIGGHDVQILRFDGNDNAVLVKVDTSMNIMPKQEINDFIKARL
jgi:hypothetical protein